MYDSLLVGKSLSASNSFPSSCSLFDAAQPVETARSAGKVAFPAATLTGKPHKAARSNPVRQDTAKRRGATRKADLPAEALA